MNLPKLIPSLLLASLLLSACASGPDRRPQRGEGRSGGEPSFEGYAAKPIALLFAGMDTNGDLQTSGAELIDGIAIEWTRIASKPAIGALEFGTWAEIALGSREALPSFISFDRDLNGRLSELEFDDRMRAEFAQLDKNTDGVLERSELAFRIARQNRDQQGGQQQQQRGGQDGRRPPPR